MLVSRIVESSKRFINSSRLNKESLNKNRRNNSEERKDSSFNNIIVENKRRSITPKF
jgi:hypothetical protein